MPTETIIQHKRGNTAQNNDYLGKTGEIIIDTQLKQLRVHDGVTRGGHPVRADSIPYRAGVGLTLEGDTFRVNNPFNPATLETKQDVLISGSNIKSINHNSLLGSGNINLPAFDETGTYTELRAMATTKADVGLAHVDNTSDLDKPISNAVQIALNAKQNRLVSGNTIKTINHQNVLGSGNLDISIAPEANDYKTINGESVVGEGNISVLTGSSAFKTINGMGLLGSGNIEVLTSSSTFKTVNGQAIIGEGNIVISKTDVGLSNVDNTSDANKPVSTATLTALNTKQDLLVSGTHIKTINTQSLLGSGNLNLPVFMEDATYPNLRAQATTKEDVGLSAVQNVDQTNADNLTSGSVHPDRLPSNGHGERTLSTSEPSGGSVGDIWYTY